MSRHASYFLLRILLYGLVLGITETSHFKGALISWRPVLQENDGDAWQFLVDFRPSWRRDTSSKTQCNETDVRDRKVLGHDDSERYGWNCASGCNRTEDDESVICNEFDDQDDWSTGISVSRYYAERNMTKFKMNFTGCCWIGSLVYGGNNWLLELDIDLRVRSDTMKPNTSPVTLVIPVIKFQSGCPDYVDLLLYDADGDHVSCKYYVDPSCKENVCNVYAYFKLTQQEDKCRISYNAGGPYNTNVPISIMLEDYPKYPSNLKLGEETYSSNTSLSSTTVQFIISIFHDDIACDVKPRWIEPTFANGFKATAVVNKPFKIFLRLKSEVEVVRVNAVGPLGVAKSDIIRDEDTYDLELFWLPEEGQMGMNMLCVAAKDSNQKMSEQRCIIITVADAESPCDVDNGGCSDICVGTGTSYYCECDRECWRLAPDKRTCMPNMNVGCDLTGFSVALNECAVSGPVVTVGPPTAVNTGGQDVDDACGVSVNETHFFTDIPYDKCGTLRQDDFLEIHYRNQLRVWLDPVNRKEGSGGGAETPIITRGYWYNLHMLCTFNRYGVVNGSFIPKDREEEQVLVPGLGSFQFFFDFYVDEDFQYSFSPYEYPIVVTVNHDIYFGIRSVGGASGLEVFTERCVATTNTSAGERSYTMIERGCNLDDTIKKYQSHPMANLYSVKAFLFQEQLVADSQSGSQNIYIQCSAVLCVADSPATRCQRGCITTRKRRDANDDVYLDHHITGRKKRDASEQVPTFAPNVTESDILRITVSGPFRIEVIPASPGVPAVTVVTPTRSTTTTPKTTTTTTTTTESAESSPMDSWRIIIIASSVGGILFLVLLILVVVLVAYHYMVLKPKQRIIPKEEQKPNAAWTAPSMTTNDEHDGYRITPVNRSPPPSFWDLQPLT